VDAPGARDRPSGNGLTKAAVALVCAAGAWSAAAFFLWQSKVPDGLDLSGLDQHRFFSAALLHRTASYERFTFWNQVLALLVTLLVFAAYARWGRRWIRESAAGPIGTGMMLGMLGLGLAWLSQLPFTFAQLWWERRHGLSHSGYLSYLTQNWSGLAVEALLICFALLVVMGLARLLGDRWWIAGAPFFVGLALLFAFVQPWLVLDDRPLHDPRLLAAARTLERREGAGHTPIRVETVHQFTTAPNAVTTGFGPSRRVVLWDTLLDGRFTDAEIEVVLAHELGHVARAHILKSIGWFALFAFPGAFLIARATRRYGGLARAEAVPLALFVLVALNLAALPLQNAITRHMEAEADWMALVGARDPTGQERLFHRFASTSLDQPNPGFVDFVLFDDHPTIMQRIAMASAWRARGR
jgi:STE24 endopeptidase